MCNGCIDDLFQPKMSPTLSISGMYQKPFFIVGIGPILNKELKFIFDLIALIVLAVIVRFQ